MDDLASHDFSTVIDTDAGPSASGGGAPNISEPSPEPKVDTPRSSRADLEHVFKADDKKADEGKPASEEKASVKPADEQGDKPAAPKSDPEPKEDAERPEKPADKPADGKRHIEPPKNFLPKAKEVWRNTPRDVQTEVERIVREHEEASQRTSEQTQRYESIREYDELARQNGRELKDSLAKVNQIENLMQRSPLAGLNAVLQELGPKKPDGQPISLYELAQHVVQAGPQGYQQMMAQATQQQPSQQQSNPEVEELRQQVAAMQQQQLVSSVIEPFKAANPRYDELQDDIAFFLQSGKIPASLSLQDRLATAYDMAERINPPSHIGLSEREDGPAPERRADDDFSGTKSIRSAPGSVSDDVETRPKEGESTRDSLMAELRRASRK